VAAEGILDRDERRKWCAQPVSRVCDIHLAKSVHCGNVRAEKYACFAVTSASRECSYSEKQSDLGDRVHAVGLDPS
jgi:hypothetical protein